MLGPVAAQQLCLLTDKCRNVLGAELGDINPVGGEALVQELAGEGKIVIEGSCCQGSLLDQIEPILLEQRIAGIHYRWRRLDRNDAHPAQQLAQAL
jgi:hypothetical protein